VNALNRERWDQLWRTAGLSNPFGWFEKLSTLYAEGHRDYHNSIHINECLFEFDSARHLAKQPIAVELAIWFHDSIYNPQSGDNEERSAELSLQCLSDVVASAELLNEVRDLILATKLHTVTNRDSGLMIDMDLSILGQNGKRFAEYEHQIRREYAWVLDSLFAAKRAEILQGFLKRERIYATPFFRDKYEITARRNLELSVRKLREFQNPSDS
jgi:predicted metal-dependent HD superfamily phosphohydrolase